MMNKMTIKSRLFTIFGFLIAVIVGLGVFAVVSLGNVNRQSTVISDKWLPDTNSANVLNTMTSDYRILEYRHILASSAEEMEQLSGEMAEAERQIEAELNAYRTRTNDAESGRMLDDVLSGWNSYKAIREQVEAFSIGQETDAAMNLMRGDSQALFDEFSANLVELVDYNQNHAKIASDEGDAVYASTRNLMIIVIAVVALISVIVAVLLINSIVRPLRLLTDTADKLAVGDVSVQVSSNSKDEIGTLMEAFGRMIEGIRGQAQAAERIAEGDLTVEIEVRSDRDLLGRKLKQMVESNNEVLTNINAAAEQVASGASQVSASSISLSQGATEQASVVEQLSASLEEISAQTNQNAVNAGQANELAESVKANAMLGNRQMKEMLEAMEEINEASANISKIIKVIDEIAFQTNILALNAAVEAARAGQHGKGFAVVAEEVRNLAARSAGAAKETTDMIEGSIKKAEAGTKIANDTAQALRDMVSGIEKVAELVGEIAIASNEQASGVAQINQGIMQVSQVVQTNSSTSEESAAASEELSSQATMLKQLVARFNLKPAGSAYAKYDEFSPAVLRMIESMAADKRLARAPSDEPAPESGYPAKIALSDNEFGKY